MNTIGLIVLVALVLLFGWLAVRSWRSPRPVAKWVGGIVTSLLALVFLAATVIVAMGMNKLANAPYKYTVSDVKVNITPERVSRGEKAAALCAGCHSTTGKPPLDGSKDNFLAGGPPLGVLYAPNLTPAGPLKDWTDGQIIRAIREGVDKDGHPLVIMPSQGFHAMSDQDVQSVVAYLRSQPAVDHSTPKRDLSPLAAAFFGLNMFPTSAQAPISGPVAHPKAGTIEYGKYITDAYGCRDCHGENLQGTSGGGGGPAPAAPALAGVVSGWSEEGFIKVFRQGVDPTGHQLNPAEMPWKEYGGLLEDQELKDLYTYLKSLPPVSASSK